MSTTVSEQMLATLMKQVAALDADQQLRLATYLIEQARSDAQAAQSHYRWADLRGLYPHPALGEDAQTWVSRTRSEGDDRRTQQWDNAS